jgi:hypothetical protein
MRTLTALALATAMLFTVANARAEEPPSSAPKSTTTHKKHHGTTHHGTTHHGKKHHTGSTKKSGSTTAAPETK